MRYLILIAILFVSGCAGVLETREMKLDNMKARSAELKAIVEQSDAKRKDDYLNDNPNIGENLKDAINRSELLLSMNQDQVYASIGGPSDKNKTVTSNGTSEVWTYSRGSYKYLVFNNGLLSSWQE